jgi:hypothetical protein
MSKGNLKIFSKFWALKKRFGQGRGRYVWCRWLALRNKLPSRRIRKRLCEFNEAMIQGVETSCELILFILGIERSEFDEFACQILSRRLAHRTNNLPFGSLKKRLWWIQWSDVWRCRKAMRTHFMHTGLRKKRLWRCRLSDVLSRRMALRTHNLPAGV